MAIVRIPDENKTIFEEAAVRRHLAGIGIDYERWQPAQKLPAESGAEEILAAYAAEIERLKSSGGYVTADVIDVRPETPGLEEMLAKFRREHWHDEDEVRFVVRGRGLFHINPAAGPLTCVEVEAGDLIRVPRGTRHWFDLCADREIRAVRLFQDRAGWAPHYTDSGVDGKYQPVCFGAAYVSPANAAG